MFSVLMAVYHRDVPEFLETAVRSITTEQTLVPKEIVIVCDGPLPESLVKVLERIRASAFNAACQVVIVKLEENKGLANALNAGLRVCSNDLIIRMDSDDIAWPKRLEKTKDLIEKYEEYAIYGFAYEIFETDGKSPYGKREVQGQVNSTTWREFFSTPINHPTICLRKNLVEAAGGYSTEVGRFEDWALALSVKQKGYKIFNSNEVVLSFRAPREIMLRRGGYKYAREEIRALVKIYRDGAMPLYACFLNIIIRFPVRIAPVWLRLVLYKSIMWR